MKNDQQFYEGFYERRIKTSSIGDRLKVTEQLRQYYVSRCVAAYHPRRAELRLLDVGCGRGQLTPCLSRYGDVLGVDYSHTAVEYCRRRYPNSRFEVADILEQDLTQFGRFHVIVSAEVIEHIPQAEQRRFVERLWSLLEPGGILLLTTPDRGTADLLKSDPTVDDDEYYRQYEGQPIANLLYAVELAALMPPDATLLLRKSYSPAIRFRALDLMLKAATVAFKYVPLQWVGELLRLPFKSQLLLVRKT